jgi:hypothetical protein
MPTARTTLSGPAKLGINPCATSDRDGSARKTWAAKAITITPMNATMTASSRRNPRS